MPTDHIRIMCPSLSCRKILAVPVSSRGKNVRCQSCGSTIRVPEKVVAPAPAAPSADAKAQPPAKAA
ncbi:MAG TPA: hypothetical protein PKE29_00660 [Phycisphaerales bacterium]|nr:hypothetical protein [Phycisphaerales bacterium]